MSVRVISDSPLEVLKAAALAHLGEPVWSARDQLDLFDPTLHSQRPLEHLFLDSKCMVPVDRNQLAHKRITLKCDGDKLHHVCAQLGDVPGNGAMFVTTEFLPIILIQTDRAEHPDGTIQIRGHEMGISVLTADRVIAQRNRTLQRGDGLHSYTLEKRDTMGEWRPASLAFAVPAHLIKSVTET
jgi:hypothetical protein